MHTAVIDVGKLENLGWVVEGVHASHGCDPDAFVEAVGAILREGPVALGFEAPMFVPVRDNPRDLTKARGGEGNRPFTAGAGATALVTGLMVTAYILSHLRAKVPTANVTFDWRSPLHGTTLLLFEAFVSNQKKDGDNRHIEDARLAAHAFRRGMCEPAAFESSISEPACLNLLGAVLLRTGWTVDLNVLAHPCLVVKP